MVHSYRSKLPTREKIAEGLAVLVGGGLLALAWIMNDRWLITHFPPDYFPPYNWIENGVHGARLILATVGTGLILVVRRQAASFLAWATDVTHMPLIAATILAVVLALTAADFILRSSGWQSVNTGEMQREPLRRHDPILGWTLEPSHTGYLVTGGRRIEYANDVFGFREPSQATKPDFARPTIVLAGESVMGGFGLRWDESVAGQISDMMKIQTVDLSVGGYATDQIYLHLKREFPRFQRPVAVVILFSPMLFRRNTENFRLHLGPDLRLRPAVQRSKVMDLARWAIPYRSVEETDRAILTTRAVLGSTVRLAKSRGAVPIVLVPQFLPEKPAEGLIRSRVFENIDLPVLSVPLDARWRLLGDWHPNAHAAHVIAAAISDRIRSMRSMPPGRRSFVSPAE